MSFELHARHSKALSKIMSVCLLMMTEQFWDQQVQATSWIVMEPENNTLNDSKLKSKTSIGLALTIMSRVLPYIFLYFLVKGRRSPVGCCWLRTGHYSTLWGRPVSSSGRLSAHVMWWYIKFKYIRYAVVIRWGGIILVKQDFSFVAIYLTSLDICIGVLNYDPSITIKKSSTAFRFSQL
jgi:hypothetical protein